MLTMEIWILFFKWVLGYLVVGVAVYFLLQKYLNGIIDALKEGMDEINTDLINAKQEYLKQVFSILLWPCVIVTAIEDKLFPDEKKKDD